MRFWLGKTLDRHVLLAVHLLNEANVGAIGDRARRFLVSLEYVDPTIQALPSDEIVADSIQRLIGQAYVKAVDGTRGIYTPAKKIHEGWP
jgi:hypothetical protein